MMRRSARGGALLSDCWMSSTVKRRWRDCAGAASHAWLNDLQVPVEASGPSTDKNTAEGKAE